MAGGRDNDSDHPEYDKSYRQVAVQKSVEGMTAAAVILRAYFTALQSAGFDESMARDITLRFADNLHARME